MEGVSRRGRRVVWLRMLLMQSLSVAGKRRVHWVAFLAGGETNLDRGERSSTYAAPIWKVIPTLNTVPGILAAGYFVETRDAHHARDFGVGRVGAGTGVVLARLGNSGRGGAPVLTFSGLWPAPLKACARVTPGAPATLHVAFSHIHILP